MTFASLTMIDHTQSCISCKLNCVSTVLFGLYMYVIFMFHLKNCRFVSVNSENRDI